MQSRGGGESCSRAGFAWLRAMQSAPLSYKLISPSLHNFLSFLSHLLLFLKQLKHRNETQGNTHCIPGMICLCSLHSTPGRGGRQLCANTTTLNSHKGKKPWGKWDDTTQLLPMNTRSGKKSPRAFFQVLLQGECTKCLPLTRTNLALRKKPN